MVAVVPPSWLIPMTSPRVGGASDSSNACSLDTIAFGRSAACAASRRISAAASAACSDVPQPVRITGSPASSVARISAASRAAGDSGRASRSTIRRASDGSAAIMSVM